jgi:DNA transposition AAA+ family ATPase
MQDFIERDTFITTKEHRRFVEFANTVRKHRCIGLCYGVAGVGKTLSARRYAHWDKAEPLLTTWGPREPTDANVYEALAQSQTVFYTPTVSGTLIKLRRDFKQLTDRVNSCIRQHLDHSKRNHDTIQRNLIELVIIDEAERLSILALEHLRDVFDRSAIGLILIGMPGIEKRMVRYPQLYSRIGFAHHYPLLPTDELLLILTNHWQLLGLNLNHVSFSDIQAISAIARITGGNFRLLHRMFTQIERILSINQLTVISEEVVEAARKTLVIGIT